MGFGPRARAILSSLNVAAIPVGAGLTVYSKSFSLKFGDYFGIAYKAAAAGAIDLTIQLEQSFQEPTTEGSADDAYVIPATLADIHTNLADANWHITSFLPVAMPYGRFKIVSAAAGANTLTIYIAVQESF